MEYLGNLVMLFQGRKTYIVAIVAAVLNLLVACNAISVEHLNQINVILVALGGAALRAGVAKS